MIHNIRTTELVHEMGFIYKRENPKIKEIGNSGRKIKVCCKGKMCEDENWSLATK